MNQLPPGQRALDHAPPRFGLDAFLTRSVIVPSDWRLTIDGDVEQTIELSLDDILGDVLGAKERRVDRTLDLHCVTTWTARNLGWSGRSFRDLWETIIVPRARPKPGVAHVLAIAIDKYQAALPLEELLKEDVLVADRLDGRPLTLNHGAPLRIVVPQLYGYKNIKHLSRLSLRIDTPTVPVSRFLAHPRARVDLEERSGVGAQRFWRLLYKTLVPVFLRRARPHQIEKTETKTKTER
jgi:DMSO/TMAO reductase YedYZ molybdopterin-dependent catalytic subunit